MDLKHIIREQLLSELYNSEPKIPSKFLWSGDNNGLEIVLMTDEHQETDRYGYMSMDQAKKYRKDTKDNTKGVTNSKNDIRIGVPTMEIEKIFIKNLNKIVSSFESIRPKDNKIKFVKLDKDNIENGKEEFFDYIEVVISKNFNRNIFTIITSAWSDDGNFLKTFKNGRPVPSTKVMVERYLYSNLPTVYI